MVFSSAVAGVPRIGASPVTDQSASSLLGFGDHISSTQSSGAQNGHFGENTPKSSEAGSPGRAYLSGIVDVRTLPPPGTAQWQTMIPGFTQLKTSNSPSRASSGPLVLSGSSVSITSQFDGINQLQSTCGCAPPDVQVAAGPNYVVEVVNTLVAIYFKNGTLFRTLTEISFFNSPNSIGDGKILYDTSSGRWYASEIYASQTNQNVGVDFAVSLNTDPLVWKTYTLPSPVYFPDQPIIGISDDKFVISVNDFNPRFVGAAFWVLNKAEMMTGLSAIDFNSFGPFKGIESIHPVQSLGPTTTEYMVSTTAGPVISNSTFVQISSVTGVAPGVVSVSNSTLPVSPIFFPVSGLQKGSSSSVNTDDQRVEDAVWYNGKLWLGSNDSCTPSGDNQQRSCFRLTQIDTTSLTIQQDFDVGSSGRYFFYPAFRVDGSGSLDVIYGYSSANDYPSLAVTGQAIDDASGSLSPAVILKQGTAPEASGLVRYGDYFGAGVDPSSPGIVWVAGEYDSTSGGFWSTYLASIKTVAFSVSASPIYRNVAQGSSTTSTVTLNSLGGFSGTVTLAVSVAPSGPTASLSPSLLSLSSGGTTASTLNILTSSNTPPGAYTIRVNATSGTLSYATFVTVRVGPDFSASTNQATLTFKVGSRASSIVTITSQNGFNGVVSLAASSNPLGPGLSLSTSSVSISVNGTGTASLTVSDAAPAPAGTFTITVTGTSGGTSHSVSMAVNVMDFGISIPSPVTIQAGSSTTSPITLASLDGFAGNISLLASISSTGPSISLSPTTVTLTPFSFGNAVLSISTARGLAPGNYTVTVSARTSGLFHYATELLSVFGYRVIGSQALTIPRSSSSSSVMTFTSVNNFSGVISLTASVSPPGSGLTFALNPTQVNLKPTGSNVTTLTVSTTTSTPKGIYLANVTGTSGPTVQTFLITLAITPITININSVNVFTGVNVTTRGSLSIDSPSSSFTTSGAASVLALNGTTGAVMFSKTYSMTGLPFQGSPNSYTTKFLLNIGVSPYRLSSNLIVTVSGNTTSVSVAMSRNYDVDANGVVDQADINAISPSFDCTIGQACFNPLVDFDASGKVDIFDAASLAIFIGSPNFIPNYSISLNPTSLGPGVSTGTATIVLTSLNGFAGTIALSFAVSPSGPTVSLSQTNFSLNVNGSATSTLTVSTSNAPLGSYAVNVTATSGVLVHSVILILKVQDFSLTTNISSQTHTTGFSSILTVASLGGFSGTVSLSTTITPTSPNLTATLVPTSVNVPAFGSAQLNETSMVAGSCPARTNCNWTVNITAVNGVLIHYVLISVAICQAPPCSNAPTPQVGDPMQLAIQRPNVETAVVVRDSGAARKIVTGL